MKVGDKVYVVVSTDQINKLLSVFGHDEKVAKKILIIGGGNVGFHLAKLLETSDGLRTKIIEKDKTRAEQIASELSSSIVICGDPLDEKIFFCPLIPTFFNIICFSNLSKSFKLKFIIS